MVRILSQSKNTWIQLLYAQRQLAALHQVTINSGYVSCLGLENSNFKSKTEFKFLNKQEADTTRDYFSDQIFKPNILHLKMDHFDTQQLVLLNPLREKNSQVDLEQHVAIVKLSLGGVGLKQTKIVTVGSQFELCMANKKTCQWRDPLTGTSCHA